MDAQQWVSQQSHHCTYRVPAHAHTRAHTHAQWLRACDLTALTALARSLTRGVSECDLYLLVRRRTRTSKSHNHTKQERRCEHNEEGGGARSPAANLGPPEKREPPHLHAPTQTPATCANPPRQPSLTARTFACVVKRTTRAVLSIVPPDIAVVGFETNKKHRVSSTKRKHIPRCSLSHTRTLSLNLNPAHTIASTLTHPLIHWLAQRLAHTLTHTRRRRHQRSLAA